MCTYAEAMVLKGLKQGLSQGLEEGREKGREEERTNTLRERQRAEAAEARVKELEALLAKKTVDHN